MRVVRGAGIPFEPASHEDQTDPGVVKKVLATKHDLLAGQVQMLNWSLLKVGKSFARHYHEDMQEIFVILNGEVSAIVEDGSDRVSVNLCGGDAILIDPREIHRMENTGTEDVQYLVFGISSQEGGKTIVVDG